MQCFRSFHTAERAIEGVEAMHMIRKGQLKRLDRGDAVGQAKFVESLFGSLHNEIHSKNFRALK
jgi:hypothetical protein